MSTVKDRFTVQDEAVGLLETFTHFEQAKLFAFRHLLKHPSISIFDRMARRNGRQLWIWSGRQFDCIQMRGDDGPIPMCYGCNSRKATKLRTLSRPFCDSFIYCSLECAAKDAVEKVMCEFDWCQKHRQWFISGDGCDRCN